MAHDMANGIPFRILRRKCLLETTLASLVFSCKDAAQQVLVCVQVEILPHSKLLQSTQTRTLGLERIAKPRGNYHFWRKRIFCSAEHKMQ